MTKTSWPTQWYQLEVGAGFELAEVDDELPGLVDDDELPGLVDDDEPVLAAVETLPSLDVGGVDAGAEAEAIVAVLKKSRCIGMVLPA